MSPKVTHVGFSDESNWNKGRFRSLGLVTIPVDQLNHCNDEVRYLLKESGIAEFKWKELAGAKERFAAEKLCKFAVESALKRYLRIDVLIWDIEDSRHRIPRRDDVANLGRMYYHLFRNVLRKRWPNEAIWRLHPDEHTAMDWGTLEECLKAVSTQTVIDQDIFTGSQFRLRLQREFGIETIDPIPSQDNPVHQLADLFAGLAAFSYENYDAYKSWRQATTAQQMLLPEDTPSGPFSRSQQERFQVLQKFNDLCKAKKLGVSLARKPGLSTPNPSNPLNFWLYEPQHPEDKAPVREKR